jgi:hypothetical protein
MPECYFHNRAAWTVETNEIRVTILKSGGHIAEMVLKQGEPVSPLWLQPRLTIDSDSFDPLIHDAAYGNTSESRLLSGLAGHNLCFPFWGDPSPDEFAAGMTFHGETNIRRWQLLEERPGEATVEVTLPESSAKLRRRFWIQGHALHCESEATNLSAWDRPFAWCEHVTLGPPFLDSREVRFDASLTNGFVTGNSAGAHFIWPAGTGGNSKMPDFDLSQYSERPHDHVVNSFLADTLRELAFFTAVQRRFGLLFGYLYRRADFPWMNVWECNTEKMHTRGMEFSNTPHHGTMKKLIRAPDIWGMPTYEWLNARSTVRKRFTAFLHPLSPAYRGVADVRVMPNLLEIVERETGNSLQIAI